LACAQKMNLAERAALGQNFFKQKPLWQFSF
jgi:hypothetical protein